MDADLMTFVIDFDWLDGTGVEGPDRYCWAEVGIAIGGRTIEAADLRLRGVRNRFVTSLLPLADWLVEVWPRLTEERTLADPHNPHSWHRAHSFRAGRGGGPMPDVRIRRQDDETFEITSHEDDQRPPGISLSFIGNKRASASVRDVKRELSRLIEAACEQLRVGDPWTFEYLDRRRTKAITRTALTAGRLGLTLDDLDNLASEDLQALDAFASDDALLLIAEASIRRRLTEILADARLISGLLPDEKALPAESQAWKRARLEPNGHSPWIVGWKAAELFRQRHQLDALSPPGTQLRPLLARRFDWPIDQQLRVFPDRVAGLDMVMVRPEGRMPKTLAWHVADAGQRFRVAKSLYYSLCSDDRLIVDSARMSGHSEANAFAAELLAPRAFIEQHTPPDGYWTKDVVDEVAGRCAVDARVVAHQIANRELGFLEP